MSRRQREIVDWVFLIVADLVVKGGALSGRYGFVRNEGIAFGFGDYGNLSLVLWIILFSFVVWLWWKNREEVGVNFVLIGGGLNLVDRIRWGYVVDPISFGGLWFNLADVYISWGVLSLILDGLKGKIK